MTGTSNGASARTNWGRYQTIIKNHNYTNDIILAFGGSGEIRTHGGVAPTAVFKTAALNHSATLPRLPILSNSRTPVHLSRAAARCPRGGSPRARDRRGRACAGAMPVIQARPGNRRERWPDASPTVVSPAMRQSKRRADDRARAIAVADLHHARARAARPCGRCSRCPVGERSILPGRTTTAFGAVQAPSSTASGPANWQKEMWRQSGVLGMREAELRVGRRDDPHAGLGEIARLVGTDREAERAPRRR